MGLETVRENMNISHDTISLCLELLAGVSVPVTVPDAEAKMSRLVAVRQELIAARTSLLPA